MSESFIEPESLNSTLVSLDAILDDDGAVRLLNKELSSYNFDGVIPTTASTILVSQLEVGMSFLPIGETEGALRTVVKLEFDDPQMTDTVSNDYIISYLSPSGDIQSVTYDGSQNIEVYFEDWDDKVLGTKGWLITQEGNAIFSNVAVRGRIEATEGLIDGDLIVTGSLSTSATASADGGIVFDSTGIFAYDTDGNNTFLLDATTGDITIFGTPGDDLLTGDDVSDGGTTIISANRITTGSVTGRVFRSNSTMTPTSGTGIYLDGNNNVRFSDPDATFTFNSSGLNITNGSNATLTFNSTGLSITGAGVTIGGVNPDDFLVPGDVGSSGTTSISGNRITTGVIDSAGYGGVTDGSVFAPGGMAINLDNGTITAKEFRIDAAGNAHFSGDLSAAGGSFSGTLSAGVSIDSPIITGGTLRTSATGARVTIAEYFNGRVDAGYIEFYDEFGNQYFISPNPLPGSPRLEFSGNMRFGGNVTIPTPYALSAFSISGGGSGITGLNGDNISSGTVAAARIADLSASKITSGTFDAARIPTPVTRATYANSLDSGQTGGAGITGNNVLITSIGSSTTDEILRRNTNNQMRVGGTSTIRVKKDVSPIDDLNVLDVDVVKFKYIDGYLDEKDQRNDQFIPGFIAEQMYEVLPIAVDLDKNGEPNNWNQRMIIPIIVKTIQNQQKTIDDLIKRIERLENNG